MEVILQPTAVTKCRISCIRKTNGFEGSEWREKSECVRSRYLSLGGSWMTGKDRHQLGYVAYAYNTMEPDIE